jgi:hypothetical protein
MIGQRFKLKRPLLALERPDGHAKGFHLPPGEIVTVKGGPLNGELIVDVGWNGRTVMMFTQDLQEHAELIEDRALSSHD